MHWFFWVVCVFFCLRALIQLGYASGTVQDKPVGSGTYAFTAIVAVLLAVGAWHYGHQFS